MCTVELFQSLTESNLPDSPSSWFNLSILIVFNLLNVSLSYILGGAFVSIRNNFDVTREETSKTISYYYIAIAFSGIILGATSRKFGPKNTLALANAFAVVGCFGAAMIPVSSDNLNYLSLCFFICGIAHGFILALTYQLVAGHFVSHRGKSIMLYTFFSAIRLTVHPALYTIVLSAYGLRGSWMFYSCFLVQGFVPLFLFKPGKPVSNRGYIPKVNIVHSEDIHLSNCVERTDTTAEQIRRDYQLVRSVQNDECRDSDQKRTGTEDLIPKYDFPEDKAEVEVINDGPRILSQTQRLSLGRVDETFFSSLKRLMTNYRVYAHLFCQMTGGISHMILCNTIVDYGMDTGLTFEQGNRLYVVTSVGGMVGLLPTGFFLDWKGMTDSLKMSLTMFKVVIAYALLSFATGWWLYLAAFMSGSAHAMSATLRTHLTSKFGLESISTILGFGFFLNGCLQLGVPALIGICRDGYGSYYYLYVILSVSCLTVALLYSAIYINDRRIFIKRSTNSNRDRRPASNKQKGIR